MNRDNVRVVDSADFTPPAAVDRIQRLGLIVGVIGIVAMVAGFFLAPEYFFRAYLVGWVFWMGIALGCLALSMVHHLTHGGWGIVVRRVMEAASRTLPLMLVLMIPILFGMKQIYLWADPEHVRGDHILEAKEPYLNIEFFIVRQLIYFAVWMGLAWLFTRMSARQDRGDDPGVTRRMQAWAGPGIILYCLLVTFASVDWLMSTDPHWFSTIYGIYLIGSQGLAAIAFLILVGLFLMRREPMSRVLTPHHFHDWGKLLLAFVMLWAYFCFSQFLITWSGNLPEEIQWYLHRTRHGWGFVAVALALFHFALPFVMLLSRSLKRHANRLRWVAIWMLFMRLVDLFWQVEPSFEHKRPEMYWLYLAAPAAIGGLWLFFFVWQLKRRPLLPVNDPYLQAELAHE
jgi:hypothetical protein